MTPPPPWDWNQLNRNWFEGGGAPPPPPRPLELIGGDMLAVVLGCHEGTIGYGRLFLNDCFFVCRKQLNRNQPQSQMQPTLSQAVGTLARHSFTALSWYTLWWHSCKTLVTLGCSWTIVFFVCRKQFSETGTNHNPKCNQHFRKLLARLHDALSQHSLGTPFDDTLARHSATTYSTELLHYDTLDQYLRLLTRFCILLQNISSRYQTPHKQPRI